MKCKTLRNGFNGLACFELSGSQTIKGISNGSVGAMLKGRGLICSFYFG